MKNLSYLIIGIVATSMFFSANKPLMAQDVMKAAPEHHKVLLDNDKVRVLEVRIKPGEKEAMHTHPATVHIELTPTKVKIGYPDGKSVILEGHQGEAIWVGPVKHTIENVGNTEIHAYIIELKDIPYKENENK